MKIRFLEPGNRPYKPTPLNYFVYDRYIRTPSVGLNTLATIVKELVDDTYMYSESISRIDMADVEDADIVFIGIFTFAAVRGYELADHLRAHGRGLVVLGGLHASMNCAEAARHCDYVLLGEGDETIRAFVEAVGRGERPDFPGLAWMEGEELRSTGYPPPPERFETIADRNLVHNYSKMVGHSTLWPQVHASRGCPHNCDYCALVRHFGRRVRTRSPENVVADIRESIRFFHRGHVRLAKDLWLTDDNFFADRDWAMSVLRAIVDSGIRYRFNVQARYEVGFDDEMLDLLRQAGFFELDLGIEFLDDASFATYHKKSTRQEIIDAIRNIRAHGLSVRGLFILGSDDQEAGVGDQLADLVIQNSCDKTLQKLIDACGPEGFIQVENEILRELNASKSIIATGGSAVYSDEAMKHLAEIGTIVYLKITYDQLVSRLSDLQERGVVLKGGIGMSLRELYDERLPLYEQYAEVTVDVNDLSITAAARKVADALKQA